VRFLTGPQASAAASFYLYLNGPEILSAPQEYFSATAANSQEFLVIVIFSVSISHLLSDGYHPTKAF
jgi:hypothetical protein